MSENNELELEIICTIAKEFTYIDYHSDAYLRARNDIDHTDLSLIKKIEIKNKSEEMIPGLMLSFKFSSDIFHIDDIVLPPFPVTGGDVRLPFIKVDKKKLSELVEPISCSLRVEVISINEDLVVASDEHVFNVLPISLPTENINKDPRLLAKYVTPLSSHVKNISNQALLKNNGNYFLAYQNFDKNEMLKEIERIYITLHDLNIIYQNPPASTSLVQRIRMIEEVIKDKKATCLDSSILFCACLLEIGYYPLLITIDNHAFVGVYLWDYMDKEKGIVNSDGIYTNLSDIKKLSNEGKVIFIETTCITSGNEASLQDAIDMASKKLKMYSGHTFNAIDINWCHSALEFKPIHTDKEDYELENYVKQKEIRDRDLNPIITREYKDIAIDDFAMNRFVVWERKLLDLSERNKLVSYKFANNNSIRLIGKDFIKQLLKYDTLDLHRLNTDSLGIFIHSDDKEFKDFFTSNDLEVLCLASNESSFNHILKVAKSAQEETGSSTLYLSIGILNYANPNTRKRTNKDRLCAPFLLLPVTIRKDVGRGLCLHYDLGDLRINETVFEYMKVFNKELNFDDFYNVNDITNYLDIVDKFRVKCQKENIDVDLEDDRYYISNISFANQIMYLDMINRRKELQQNPIVKSIISNGNLLTSKVISDEESVENLEKYEDFAAPLPYDSSQLKAILDCGAGKSFILDGPPGTGKSQTIVNMIVNAFYNGKKVLFVAEKKAALDVVYKRLESIGLGRFCLELHSNKSTKGDFFSKLGSSMEFGQTSEPDEYKEKCIELTRKKNELRKKINDMHDQNEHYFSLYDCIVNTKRYQYLDKYKIEFNKEFLMSLDKDKYNKLVDLIYLYESKAKNISNFDGCILKPVGIEDINFFTDKETILKDVHEIRVSVEKFIKETKKFIEALPFKVSSTTSNVENIFKLYDYIINKNIYVNAMGDVLLNSDNMYKIFEKMEYLLTERNKFNELMDIDALLSNTNITKITKKLRKANGMFSKNSAVSYAKKEFKPYFKDKVNKAMLGNIVLDIENYIEKKEELLKDNDIFNKITGLNIYKALDELDSVKENYELTKEFVTLVKGIVSETSFDEALSYFLSLKTSDNPVIKMNYALVMEAFNNYKVYDDKIVNKYKINKDVLSKSDNYFDSLLELLEYMEDKDNYGELVDISTINKLNDGFINNGIYDLLLQVIHSNCRYNELKALLDLSLSYGYLGLYFTKKEINDFLPSELNEKINKYKDAISEYNNITIEYVSSKLSEKFVRNDVNYSEHGAIGRLKKSISVNGRGVSIRNTLSEFSDVILTYFPCFLMSPLSAAQYLSVDDTKGKAFSKFDIVIFDEASQIPTCEAIGPIARGNSLIVAGDPKQMPPSPYFSAGLQIYDDEEDDINKFSDSSSLLQECLDIELPRHRLCYHYRSKHEALIEFSNHNFYNDSLYTFPSSSSDEKCIEFNYVKTSMIKQTSEISDEELSLILKKFKEIYNNPKTQEKSVGIISFNIKQADKISSAISNLLASDARLNAKVEKVEPWFVKSIENVQGDERDIIILSIGFGLTKAGYPRLAGPLIAGDNNGQKRLNVVASRSKEKMIVISTIRYNQFRPDNVIKNPGELCIKKFLKYVEEAATMPVTRSPVDDSSILYFIKRDLEKLGFIVDANVGNSEFRVDLAIKNNDTGDYELGIIIDTKLFNDYITCRDKYYVQDKVLNSMKWKTIHVYALEYFKYPKETINKIIEEISKDYVRDTTRIEANITKAELSAPLYEIIVDEEIDLPYLHYDKDSGYAYNAASVIRDIIKAYSPIAYSDLKKLVAKACGFSVFSENRENELEAILNEEFYTYREYDQSQYFYWRDDNRELKGFRVIPKKDLYDISRMEIANCMMQITRVQGTLPKEDLYKYTLELLECNSKVLNKRNKDRLMLAYKWAKDKGML
ncbi:MAG: DUF4011 domain-containing protein [Bacilli bacterium]|nr:DUF4011 domain-containing protein [Bacilli bacterium]